MVKPRGVPPCRGRALRPTSTEAVRISGRVYCGQSFVLKLLEGVCGGALVGGSSVIWLGSLGQMVVNAPSKDFQSPGQGCFGVRSTRRRYTRRRSLLAVSTSGGDGAA